MKIKNTILKILAIFLFTITAMVSPMRGINENEIDIDIDYLCSYTWAIHCCEYGDNFKYDELLIIEMDTGYTISLKNGIIIGYWKKQMGGFRLEFIINSISYSLGFEYLHDSTILHGAGKLDSYPWYLRTELIRGNKKKVENEWRPEIHNKHRSVQ